MMLMEHPEDAVGADKVVRPHGCAVAVGELAGQMCGIDRYRAGFAGEAGRNTAIDRMQVGVDRFGIEGFRAWPRRAAGPSARWRKERAVIGVVIENARRF